MNETRPTYRAELTFTPGVDETRRAVLDEHGEIAAEITWRPTTYETAGPAKRDYQLHKLGYSRASWWRPDSDSGAGFASHVEPIT